MASTSKVTLGLLEQGLNGLADATETTFVKKTAVGAIAAKDEIAKTELATALAEEIDAKATTAYVNQQIAAATTAAYKPAGNATLATLPTPSADNVGNVYNMTEDFVVPDNGKWVDHIGTTVYAGTDVGIVSREEEDEEHVGQTITVYKFNVFTGHIDLSGYATTTALNDATAVATSAEVQAIIDGFYVSQSQEPAGGGE